VIWKLARFIDELRQDYGHDKQLAPVWAFRLRPDSSRVLTFRVRDAGMELARRDIAEHDRISAKFERAVQANKSGRSRPRRAKAKRHRPKKRQQTGNRGDHP
jgi:plasmid stabilization system protein ParE